MEDYRLEQTGPEVQRILNGAAMDANLQAEVERATDAEGTLQGNIDSEERARQDADGLLQQGISDEENRAKRAEEANAGEIEGIKALIPSTASEANKLADTNYVNSSIQTATAEYRGDYNVVTDLHLSIDATHAQIETLLGTVIAEADKNDYCYVMIPTSAQTPTEIAKIERYKMTSEGWKFEYDVNNSTFTAEEWAAIKSGITSGLVTKLNALPTNADLMLLLAGKQDDLTFDSVPVPESNNPVKSGGVYSAIDDEKTARLNSDTAIHTELDGLQAKVPATASSDNKLVDQNQMNSSISTATATFRGDWNVVSDLHLAVDATRAQIATLLPTVISTADNNDYCYVEIPTSAETPTQIERVERYKFNGTAWGYEYVLNNSGFTAAQWAAINSMITSGLVAKLTALPTNTDLLAMFATKQDVLTFDSTPTENSTNPVTSGGVFAADKALSDAIEAILLLIPSAASSLNKLVDTSLMNSSISTATATFRGTYNLVSDLSLGIDATEGQIAAALLSAISTADNNDYSFVQIPTSAETPAQIARTDRYKFNGTAWGFEYTLNTSGFTAAQWAAINSTITSALVSKLNALPTAAELQEVLGTLTSGITAINQKIPSTASQSNKLVDASTMESYIAQVINILDASFNVTSTDGHITLHITQVDGVITSVQVQSTDIASAADLALKASQADLTALASRVSTDEGNITSLTGRMGTAETNIANLQQLYNDLQQSKPVPVTELPSTGQQQGIIYRLAGTTSYSDYMWNGSTWVLMATYNNAIDPRPKKASQNLVTSGGVFDNMGALDVSELNATENPHTLAQYTDLSSALAAIPTDYQKGGMSIKYVQTSDNKYVQYLLTKETWSATESDWEKMNLEDEVNQLEHKVDYYNIVSLIESSYITGYIKDSGQLNKIGDEVGYGLRYISVTSGNVYYFEATSVNNLYPFIAFAQELQTGATCDIIAGKTNSGVTVKQFYKAESNGYLLVWAAFSSPTTEVGHFYSTTESNINDVVRKNVSDITSLTGKTDKIQENNYRGNGISIIDGSNNLDLDIANNFVFCYAKTERAINARIQIVYDNDSIHKRIGIYGEGSSEIYVRDNSVGIIETDDIIFLYDWSKHTSNYNEWYATSHLSLSQNITESIYSKIKSNSQLVDKCVEKLTKVVERTLESTTFDQAYVKDDKTIASYSGSYILYYPVTKGVEYTISLNNWGAFASYPAVCFSANTPVIGQEVDKKIYQASSDTRINLEFDWTASADGYLYLSHWSGTAKITCLLDYLANPVLYKDVVTTVQVFGDSISDNTWGDYRTWVDIAIQYIKASSVKIINSAIGGTHLCSNSTTAGANESGVWKVIENGLNKYMAGIGRSTSALKLQSDTTIAVIFAGTNDFNDNYALGDITDSGEGIPLTVCSAVHRILTYISTNYPSCHVIWVTPMQRYNITDQSRPKDSLGRTVNTAGWTLQEAGDKIAEICALYSVPCIKMYDVLGINEDNINTYTTDGLHPNIKGDEVIATAICDKINQIIVDSPVLGNDKKPVTVTISGGAADYSDILQITPADGVTETSMVNYDSEGRLDTYLIDLIPGKENAVVVKKNDGTKYSIDSITGTGVTYSNGKLLITSETTAMTIAVSE